MHAVAVYCGSQPGRNPAYMAAAIEVGARLAREGKTLIYGGGRTGLMGAVADAALAGGGRVVGVMPRDLVSREIAHTGLSELQVVNSMHERKWRMAEIADGFLSLPGGAGTLEEFFEQWTWGQLGFHDKPNALLDVDGYFEPLCATIRRMVEEGFLAPDYEKMLIVSRDLDEVMAAMAAYIPPPPKWTGPPPAMV
jgi:uncharacterized protein (TIGR00730 family)